MKKITIITLLLITALAVHGCGNKKNVSDNETVKETASSVIQQETVRLSTQETTTEQITDSETALEKTKTSASVEIADYSQISDETVPQTAEPDNNRLCSRLCSSLTVFPACNCPVAWYQGNSYDA